MDGWVLLQAIVNGLMLGGVYAAAGVGLSLMFGVMGIINVAHGEFIMLGAFATYWLAVSYGVDPFLGLVVSFGLMFGLGYVLQRLVLYRVVGTPETVPLLATFGLGIVMSSIALRLWSADYRVLDVDYLLGAYIAGFLIVPLNRLAAALGAWLLVLLLYLLLEKTELGRAIRATAQDAETASLFGINPGVIYALTFGLAAGISGAAGSLVLLFDVINPYMGLLYTLFAFATVVIGGTGYIPGVFWGGIALGVVQSLTETYLEAGLSLFMAFLALYLVLVFRPAGLLGRGRLG